ncbi:MAG: hypothetical protein R3F38_18955 [Gammaproteobacteria bacterium]
MSIESLFPNGVLPYLAGGICIGLAVSLIFVFTGQVAGMSSVFSSSWSWLSRKAYFQQPRLLESRVWRLWLALGLIGGAALYWFGLAPVSPGRPRCRCGSWGRRLYRRVWCAAG